MKIGLITDNYPYTGDAPASPPGGIGTYTQIVAEELARCGHDVHVFALAAVRRHRSLSHNGVTLWQCPVWSRRREMGVGQALEFSVRHRGSAWKLGRFSIAVAARRAAAGGVFDLIETPEFGALGDCIPKKLARRWAVRLHLPSSVKRRRGGAVSAEWTPIELDERQLVRRADVVTAPTAASVGLIERVWEQKLPGVRVVGNPIRPVPVPPERLRRQTILYFGRLEHTKGVDVLAASVGSIHQRHPDTRVCFVGADVQWDDGRMGSDVIRALAPRGAEGTAYQIESPLDHAALMTRIPTASVCVLPSRFETFGLTLVESLMCGTPVVAAEIEAFVELTERGRCAQLHRPEDSDDLADCVCRLLESPELSSRLADAGRAHAMRWAPDRIVSQLLEAWFR